MKTRSHGIDFISFLFILLFVYAAASKLMDMEKFRAQAGQSPLIYPVANLVIWTVPLLEILISILLIIPRSRLLGFYSSFGLMVLFSSYIVILLRFSDFVPCSCGGVLEKMTWTQHLVFNIAFVLLGLAGIILEVKQEALLTEKNQ